MKITMEIARKVLFYVRQGLTMGMGKAKYKGDMCVEHAVARATGATGSDDPEADEYSATDSPACVASPLAWLGIELNDAISWHNEKQRAGGLQRFAVAQLGTATDSYRFNEAKFIKLMNRMAKKYFPNECGWGGWISIDINDLSAANLKKFADCTADVLEKMRTPGSKFLCMVDWSAKDLAKPLDGAK